MTEQQFEAAMRTFNLELQYRDYIMERASLENGDGILYRAANDINVTLDKANIVVKYATKYCITYGLNHKLCDGVDYLCNEIRSFKQRLL